MKKLQKINPIFAFFLGIILTGTTAYAAYKIQASEVSYIPENENFKVDNVNSALDSLYAEAGNKKIKLLSDTGTKVNANSNIHTDKIIYTVEETGDLLLIVFVNMSGNLKPNTPEVVCDNANSSIEPIVNNDTVMQVSGQYGHAYTYSYRINNTFSGNKITISTDNPRAYGTDAGGIDTVTLGYQVYKIG